MNIGIISAAGVGSRIQSEVPKQFIKVDGKSILMYTVENVEKAYNIDKIVIVCHKDFINEVKEEIDSLGFEKVVSVVSGGNTGFESLQKGSDEACRYADNDNDVFLLIDSVRPLCPTCTIEEVVSDAAIYGSASVYTRMSYAIVNIDEKDNGKAVSNSVVGEDGRKGLGIEHTPNAIQKKKLYDLLEEAKEAGYDNPINISLLQLQLGKTLNYVLTTNQNIKITRQEDLELFKAIVYYKNHYKKF